MAGTATRPGGAPIARRARRGPVVSLVVVLVLALAAVVVPIVLTDGPRPLSDLRILVPNPPGGGYDVTARSAAKVLSDTGIAGPVEVFNLSGAGGIAGLGRVEGEAGNGRLLMSMGLGIVGATASRGTPLSLAGTTPVARLVEESEIVVVPADSPYRDVRALLDAWRAGPGGLTAGGGSSVGGPDHLATMLLAEGTGIAPARVRYVSYEGGGPLLAAVLRGEVGFAVSGVGEFADQIGSGDLRVLAVTAGERVPGLDVPTLRESGVDVEFSNWRGLVAPPGLPDADRAALADAVSAMRDTPEWRQVLAANGWRDAWLPGADFARFTAAENERVEHVLGELGLRTR
ncbi:Bug family tripartite tricarboxylate transporter substrate binding protein [Pseudonocardia alni]|uniref:Tricarboxylic transport membrane protein n=1 Tax=Pseudonocardia alni TaxID=33907 RepID=A0A852W5G2_PSEA5|nr:tripartite tricarboxylate transporter substrate binding protein [Pseudonocardia antarctica]NYG01585.1 putative tricarboxylic transport membrane protein [Pseudonocardia antarctica]